MNSLLTPTPPAVAPADMIPPATDLGSLTLRPPKVAPPATFRLDIDDAGIGWLTFDQPGTSVNIFNETTFRELNAQLDIIEREPALKALVIRSAKDKVFIAGADLKSIRALPPERVSDLLALGQTTFNRLAALPVVKAAMIHGACVGGGFELALACDIRVASDADCTRIGLPETQLGLLPGWGGSTRLPRLINPLKALDLILTGKLLKATKAKKLGLVDDVVPREHLETRTAALVRQRFLEPPPGPSFMQRMQHLAWKAAMPAIAMKARRDLKEKTRGLYAAPMKALEVIEKGFGASMEDSMALERQSLRELMRQPETGRLIDLFFKKEEAGKKAMTKGHALPITEVAVIGAGVMGAGIAHWLAGKGLHVTLTDISPDAVAKGMAKINKLVGDAKKRRLITKKEARETLDHISPAHTLVPLHRCQLVIEAATEDLELKKKIFAGLAARCAPDAILATNTSALSVTALATVVPHPERVIGLHFFNPVHRMPLVEVISLPESSDDAVATAFALVQRIGKTPVLVKDSPGFVVNRVLIPYLMGGVRLFEEGHSPKVIDEAMLDFGMPMGPMRLLDEIGLDVAAHVAATLLVSSDVLTAMVNKGWLGKKSGKGFYIHSKGGKTSVNAEARELGRVRGNLMPPTQIRDYLSALLSAEAQRCLKEGVAATAADIDLAMVLGTGYAPFRGGPIAHSLTSGNVAKTA